MRDAILQRVAALGANVVRRLPQYPPSAVVAAALSAIVRDHPDASLEGRVVRIAVVDAGLTLTLRRRGSRFEPALARDAADVTIRARLADFVALASRREDSDTLFFARRLSIEGDTEAGLIVKNMLDAVDVTPFAAPLRALDEALRRAGARSA
ncbi:MAG: SCP2 sterol-binding domain-containing protein [Burkholderiales bacterium]|nr:SCP2 sterol-binding domain-containing protein [Burkholderiales bacterium]